MQKALQKFTSAFLAANMIFSIVATNFVAYAEETPNVLPASEEIMAYDAVDPGDAVALLCVVAILQDCAILKVTRTRWWKIPCAITCCPDPKEKEKLCYEKEVVCGYYCCRDGDESCRLWRGDYHVRWSAV